MSDEGRERKPLKFSFAKSKAKASSAKPWKILVVDDDEEVHLVTKLVLRDKIVFDRPLKVIDARSGREAETILREEEDIACILLDVVMEENDSGLKIAKILRNELRNLNTRIVLRTGQPGQAPEGKVILEYAINDYKEKTELTEQKLFTTVVTAIRGYRDIITIEESRKGMKMIIDASSDFFTLRSMDLFAAGILRELISLLYLSKDALYGMTSGLSFSENGSGLRVCAGTGKYQNSEHRLIEEVLDETQVARIEKALRVGGPVWDDGSLIVIIRNRDGRHGVIYLEDCPPANEIETQLISLFCTNVSEAFSGISMHQALETAFREREILVKEVHHRVRNNLQLVAGLINMAIHDETLSPLQTLRETGARIQSMASVHSYVFSGERFETVDFATFLPAHINALRDDYIQLSREAPVHVEISDFVLPLSTAIPCGLVLNELIVAALDYTSAREEESALLIKLERLGGNGDFRCLIAEEKRFPSGTRVFMAPNGIASRLMGVLTEQLNGRLSMDFESGLRIVFEFPDQGDSEEPGAGK